jgi:tetratricopeptide (TPR) repeat protein
MRARAARVLVATVACLLWLNGCETSTRLGDLFQAKTEASQAGASQDDPVTTGSLPPASPKPSTAAAKAPSDKNDDGSLGKKHFRDGNFSLAERHFRRAVELHPRDLESWIGLAACYDRQRRFDLADRAYDQVLKIVGPIPEVMNNRGFSYILRGDYRRARETLLAAHAKDPKSPFIANNLRLLDESEPKAKAVN